MADNNIRERARKIINSAVNAVMITLDSDGFPHPRTMWTAGIDEDFTTYFVTGRNLVKCKQIERNPKICLFWTEMEGSTIGWSYALIKGTADITNEQAFRDRFWMDALQEYFPGGKDDPDFVVIIVHPKELMLMDEHKYPLDRIEF